MNDIKDQINEIKCTYIANKKEKEINLIHNYNADITKFSEDAKNIYLEAKKLNTNIFEGNTELYINDNKIKFDYKYKIEDSKEIKVIFKFKKN